LSATGCAVPILVSAALSAVSVLATHLPLAGDEAACPDEGAQGGGADDSRSSPGASTSSTSSARAVAASGGVLLLRRWLFAAFTGGLALFLDSAGLTWNGKPLPGSRGGIRVRLRGLLGIPVQSFLGGWCGGSAS
jgi:hypothetical protein